MEREATIRRGMPNKRSRKPAGYWLIVGREDPSRTLTLYSELRGEILPVFGSEEDASVFLMLLRAMGGGLEVRYMAVEGLVSLLSGPLSNITRVALDPTPEMDADAMLAPRARHSNLPNSQELRGMPIQSQGVSSTRLLVRIVCRQPGR